MITREDLQTVSLLADLPPGQVDAIAGVYAPPWDHPPATVPNPTGSGRRWLATRWP